MSIMTLSEREQRKEFCDATEHHWKEEYYGYECENCDAFIPYGCEPWMDEEYVSMEYYPEQEYPDE